MSLIAWLKKLFRSPHKTVHNESVAQSSNSFCDCASPNICCNTNVPEEGKLVDQRDQLEILKKQLEVLRAATQEKLYPKQQVVSTDEDGEYENCYDLK